jgi:hypothetical protein
MIWLNQFPNVLLLGNLINSRESAQKMAIVNCFFWPRNYTPLLWLPVRFSTYWFKRTHNKNVSG